MLRSRMLRLRTRLLALVTALLVALPLGAVVRDQVLCRMAGRVMSSCCCARAGASHHEASDAQRVPEARKASCCERLSAHAASPSAVRDGADRFPSLLVATVPPSLELAAVLPQRLGGEGGARVRAPPPTGPPLFLKHCSFLI